VSPTCGLGPGSTKVLEHRRAGDEVKHLVPSGGQKKGDRLTQSQSEFENSSREPDDHTESSSTDQGQPGLSQ
jgi:hypothetical protein